MDFSEIMEIVFLLALFVGIVGWFIHRLSIGKKKMTEAREAIKRKHYENLTEYEKFVALQDLNAAYNGGRGLLDGKSYDILVSKINGTKSMAELQIEWSKMMSNDTSKTGAGASNFSVGDIAVPKKTAAEKQREATKTIVKDAVVGGVIAGPAGAVVGAIVGKNKAENKEDT